MASACTTRGGPRARQSRRRSGERSSCCGEVGRSRPRARRDEEALEMTVHERDVRQVGVVLEAQVARSPLREELAVEGVETLDLEEAIAAQEQPADQPVPVLRPQDA